MAVVNFDKMSKKGDSIFTKGLKKKAFPDYSPNYEFGKKKVT